MRHHTISLLGAALLAMAFGAAPLAAQGSSGMGADRRALDLDASVRVGTLGLGLEASKLLTDRLGARVGINFGSYSLSQSQADIMYSAELKLQGMSALVDLYPWSRGRFHLTGGFVTSPMKITAVGEPSAAGTFEFDGQTYTSSEVGSLVAEAKFASGPYAGIGFGSPAKRGGPLKFKFDIGAIVGKANLSLKATGAAANPILAGDLEAQRQRTQKDLDKFAKIYPVISIGLGYGF